MLSTSSDAALLGLLIPAMRSGADLDLEGAVSSSLLDHARGTLQTVLREALPGVRRIRVNASTETESGPASTAVGLGFSAGVDSLFSILQHRDPALPSIDGPAPDHLQFFSVGSHGVNGRTVFEARRAHLERAAAVLAMPLVWLDSNLDDFFDLNFQLTHPLRNAAAAHVLSRGMGVSVMSSTGIAKGYLRERTVDLSQWDRLLFPACSTSRLRLVSVGMSYPRVEKTRVVSRHAVTHDMLDVCTKSRVKGGNCSACWKCLRTMLTLDVLGRLDSYAGVFNLRRYRWLRPIYAVFLWGSDRPLSAEVLAFALQARFQPILASRRWRWLGRLLGLIAPLLQSIMRRLPARLRREARRAWSRI